MVAFILKGFKERKGSLVAMFFVGEGILGMSVGFLIPFIVSIYDWRVVWWSFGLLLLLFTIFLWLTLHDASPSPRFPPPQNCKRGHLSEVLRLPKIWSLGLVYFLHAITRGVFVTFSVTYLVSKGAPYAKASNAFSFMAVGFVPGAILAGLFSDRFNPKFFLIGLLILQIISIGSLFLNPTWLLIYGLFAMVGFCMTGVPTLMGVIPSLYYKEEVYGKALGFLTLMLGLGVTVSPILGGYVGDLMSSLGLPMCLGIVTSCLALATLILTR
jgi:predicted MFS family arabinose efflux permease